MQKNTKITNLPTHVGVIMDGNGRWAKQRNKPRSFGHNAGMKRMISMARHARDMGIKYVTVYALSTENMARPQNELDVLYDLLRKYFSQNVKEFTSDGCAVKIIGDISALPQDVQEIILKAEKSSDKNAEFTMIFALNYGGRTEILRAVNSAILGGQPIDERGFSSLLYTDGIPEPDLIIRTGKEKRLSNFLTFQSAYSELYFTDVLFPDFNNKEFDKAIADYSLRDRRFGKVK